jgi:hypothetical protein
VVHQNVKSSSAHKHEWYTILLLQILRAVQQGTCFDVARSKRNGFLPSILLLLHQVHKLQKKLVMSKNATQWVLSRCWWCNPLRIFYSPNRWYVMRISMNFLSIPYLQVRIESICFDRHDTRICSPHSCEICVGERESGMSCRWDERRLTVASLKDEVRPISSILSSRMDDKFLCILLGAY